MYAYMLVYHLYISNININISSMKLYLFNHSIFYFSRYRVFCFEPVYTFLVSNIWDINIWNINLDTFLPTLAEHFNVTHLPNNPNIYSLHICCVLWIDWFHSVFYSGFISVHKKPGFIPVWNTAVIDTWSVQCNESQWPLGVSIL